MVNIVSKSNLGRRGLSSCPSSRKSRQHTEQEPRSRIRCRGQGETLPTGSLLIACSAYFNTQDLLARGDTAHSELGFTALIINLKNAPQASQVETVLFPSDSGLCKIDIKLMLAQLASVFNIKLTEPKS